MSAPRSLRAAIDGKCRECGGQDGGARHWRVHVSACAVTACPLWTVRPLATRNAPAWLASRDPSRLPPGWRSLSQDAAVAAVQGDSAVMQPFTARNNATAGLEAPERHAQGTAPVVASAAMQGGGRG